MTLTSIGWMIAALTCHGSEYNCEVTAYESPPTVYETRHDCEWSLSGKTKPDGELSRVECVEIQRPEQAN